MFLSLISYIGISLTSEQINTVWQGEGETLGEDIMRSAVMSGDSDPVQLERLSTTIINFRANPPDDGGEVTPQEIMEYLYDVYF